MLGGETGPECPNSAARATLSRLRTFDKRADIDFFHGRVSVADNITRGLDEIPRLWTLGGRAGGGSAVRAQHAPGISVSKDALQERFRRCFSSESF
jgi:hypothetical protein